MMELHSIEESVISHYKDGILVAITHFNGRTIMNKVEEMSRKDYQEFFETHHANSGGPASGASSQA